MTTAAAVFSILDFEMCEAATKLTAINTDWKTVVNEHTEVSSNLHLRNLSRWNLANRQENRALKAISLLETFHVRQIDSLTEANSLPLKVEA